MKKALIVLSGGQDSTTCLAFMKHSYPQPIELHAITFNYGQTHSRELDCAGLVGQLAGIATHEVVQVGPILKGTSPLTDPSQTLETYTDHDSMEAIIGSRVEKTFVPMRNALFLTLAANRAAVLGCEFIVTGVCQADNANYPDCRADFINAQEDTINEALGASIEHAVSILTPLMSVDKAASVRQMAKHGAEVFAWLAFTHTAYDGNYPPTGKDHASVLRAYGFEKADLPDPLVLRAWQEGLMTMPASANYRPEVFASEFTQAVLAAIAAHKIKLGFQ